MKQLIHTLVLGLFTMLALLVYGHEGHDHGPVSIKSALEISVKMAKNYSAKPSPFEVGLLPASWAKLTERDARIHENKLGYYVVSLNNAQEHQTIYFKIALDGTVKGVNFSGNFPAVSAHSSSVSAHGG